MTQSAPQDIKIMAQPLSTAACKFTVDRPVLAGWAYHFGSKEQAEASPLARRIFEIPGVVAVLIAEDRVTITKGTHTEWQAIGKQVGAAIRAHVGSGEPALSADLVASLPGEDEIRERIQDVLDRDINPSVASHGGHIALLDVRGNSIYLRMGGGCQGCGMAEVTLKQGVERALRQAVPELGEILDATDHAAGANPYYASKDGGGH